ncbi:hypothetical protein LCGC14_1685730 [marine sediment metagenome]|uniref:Uncharacterized protein n=1 Tax=marine sediment metagenome TaxID=412755 RepID=A0A0F9KMC0_9ZZZZ
MAKDRPKLSAEKIRIFQDDIRRRLEVLAWDSVGVLLDTGMRRDEAESHVANELRRTGLRTWIPPDPLHEIARELKAIRELVAESWRG